MRDNSNDRTLERSYIQKWQFLISEYELVKAKKHPHFRFVQDAFTAPTGRHSASTTTDTSRRASPRRCCRTSVVPSGRAVVRWRT